MWISLLYADGYISGTDYPLDVYFNYSTVYMSVLTFQVPSIYIKIVLCIQYFIYLFYLQHVDLDKTRTRDKKPQGVAIIHTTALDCFLCHFRQWPLVMIP